MSVKDEELSHLRDARRAQLQEQLQLQAEQQANAEEQTQAAEAEKSRLNDLMRSVLTPEARSRLARLELAYPELSTSVKTHLASLHSGNKIAIPVDDASLKRILSGLQSQRRETTIRRV